MGSYPALGSIGFQMDRKMKKESIKMVKKVEYGTGGIETVKKNIEVNM